MFSLNMNSFFYLKLKTRRGAISVETCLTSLKVLSFSVK